MKYEIVEGAIIPVRVGSRTFDTVITNGVQRFVSNTVIRSFVDASGEAFNEWLRSGRNNGEPEPYSLNTVDVEYHQGKHSVDDLLTLYTSIGYSVSGFMDLSLFDDLEIRNPLWEQDQYHSLPPQVLEELMDVCGIQYESSSDVCARYFVNAIKRGEWNTDRENGDWISDSHTVTQVVNGFLRSQDIELSEVPLTNASDELKAFVENLLAHS